MIKVLYNRAVEWRWCMYLDGVGVGELCIAIDVRDILVPERHPVAPVEGAYVGLHCIPQLVPVVFVLLRRGEKRETQYNYCKLLYFIMFTLSSALLGL